jgi:hypothetical protein
MTYRFALAGVVFVVAATTLARAENVIVIPGRPDVPVIINYHDARWAVVEGEQGLNRPGHVTPTVIGGKFVGPIRYHVRSRGYFPSTGTKPELGRFEREPTTPAPSSAENFSRSWSSTPAPTAAQPTAEPVAPADLPNSNPVPLGEGVTPPIIVAPQIRRRH